MMNLLSETFGMRFYYWTGLNWIILFPLYVIGLALIALLWWWLAKRMKRPWAVTVPLLFVLAIGPWVEELWIAWNFGRLCKKDAGVFINKTVEVEGFYDTTRPTTPVPRNEQAAQDLDRGGYKFYEMVYPNTEGGPSKVVRLEKVNGVWTPTVLDSATARYHYTTNIYGERAAHKITRQESRVTDKQANEVIGRYIAYGRRPPWFFIGLGEVPYSCDGPDGGPNSKYNRLIYRDVLKPIQ
ncbi:MAG: hypothetical protein WDZ63_05215 [Burkholderiales bacterium]